MDSNHKNVKLTAAELSYLWNIYLADSMSVCLFKYFLEHIEDEDIRSLLTQALNVSQQHLTIISEIFTKEQIQIPQGFTENDVNLKAKRLFSDVFYLKYADHMIKAGLATYGRALQSVYREDIRLFFEKCIESTVEMYEKSTRLVLGKGVATRELTIPYPQKLEFVHKQSFILEGLGRREALTGAEVTQLHFNIQTNLMGSSLATAFSQVTEHKKLRKYLLRGKEIANKDVKVFAEYLETNSLPIPASYNQEVTESTESPFSDKLMLFHFGLLIYSGVGNYGVAISQSRKSDLVVDLTRLTGEILKFAEDGVNIMIEEEWMEQPPMAANRKDLVKKK